MKGTLPILLAVAAMVPSAWSEDAKSPQQVVRNILQKHDQSGVPTKEIVTGTATFPSGSQIGFHTHPGDESGYVTKGSVVLKVKGQHDRTVNTGESFFNSRGVVHSVVSGPDGATVVSTWIIDKGAPLATPVP